MRIALGLQYDGAAFSGWQSQPHANTVQDVLERALCRFTAQPLTTVVAGRTDAGVHALGQVVHFDTDIRRSDFSWVRGVNTFLPQTVAVQWAMPVPDTFHARFAARERTYYYLLYLHPVRAPFVASRAGWLPTALDVDAMREASRLLIGEHDFSAFRSSECQAKSPVKHLYEIDICKQGHFVHCRLRGNAFLHHMVRNIIGCLIAIGRGRRSASWLAEVRDSRDRRRAAPTFMPDGLYLAQIGYPPEFAVPAAPLAGWPFQGTGISDQDEK